jgi:hypothetical protein
VKLPPDYLRLITDGTRVLRSVGRALRASAIQHPETPELWLAVRDVEGLADRIGFTTDTEWRRGSAHLSITGQDVGVLETLLSRRDPPLMHDKEQIAALARLHGFLRQYCDFEFDVDPAGELD